MRILTRKQFQDDMAKMWSEAVHAEYKAQIAAAVLAEREACAKVCDSFYESWINIHGRYEFMGEGAQECADAIRARGQA